MARHKSLRYLLFVVLTAIAFYILITLAAVNTQMYWQTVEFVYLNAKIDIVKRCDLAPTVFLGDSGPAVGIIPNEFAPSAVNLSLIGSSPIENYFMIRHILACPNRPKQVVIAFSPHHLQTVDLFFWDMIVRSGLLKVPDLIDLISESNRLHDWTAFKVVGVSHSIIVGLPRPGSAIEALMNGRVISTATNNRQEMEKIETSRGYIFPARTNNRVNQAPGRPNQIGGPETSSARTENIPPILDHYLRKSLQLLNEAGVKVAFLATPMDQRQKNESNENMNRLASSYIARLMRPSSSMLEVLNTEDIYWPSKFFGDQSNHLNAQGASLFTQKVKDCLLANRTTNQCSELAEVPN